MNSLTLGLVGTIPLILLFAGLTATKIKSHFVTLAGLVGINCGCTGKWICGRARNIAEFSERGKQPWAVTGWK